MQRIGKDPSVRRKIASIAFRVAPSIGWRLHMSKMAAESAPRCQFFRRIGVAKTGVNHGRNMVEVTI
jgi:hypothetical protein